MENIDYDILSLLGDSIEDCSLNYKEKTTVKNIIKSVYQQAFYELDFNYEN